MTPDIIRKLQAEFTDGITTEVQVVYVMAQIRKILEQNVQKSQYEHLTFHCDWILHASLTGPYAQKILKKFDKANIEFRSDKKLTALSPGLRQELIQISGMRFFQKEFVEFLEENGLSNFNQSAENWPHFLLLYAKVIQDCSLEIRQNDNDSSIKKVTVRVQEADTLEHGERYYKISWDILDKDEKEGEFFVINSFSQF